MTTVLESADPKLNRLVAAQLCKTKMCAMYARGSCNDPKCRFAHSLKELRSPPDLTKTAICRAFTRGQCRDNRCKFAHGEQELRVTPSVYKTQLCNFFEHGHCKKGDRCRHAHGRAELRSFEAAPDARGPARTQGGVEHFPAEQLAAAAGPAAARTAAAASAPMGSPASGNRGGSRTPKLAVTPPDKATPPTAAWEGRAGAAASGDWATPPPPPVSSAAHEWWKRQWGRHLLDAPPLPMTGASDKAARSPGGSQPWQARMSDIPEPMKVQLPSLPRAGAGAGSLAGGVGCLINDSIAAVAAAAAAHAAREHSAAATAASAVAAKFALAAARGPANGGPGSDVDRDFDSIVRSLRTELSLGAPLPLPGFGAGHGGRGVPAALPESPVRTPRTVPYLDSQTSPWHPAVRPCSTWVV